MNEALIKRQMKPWLQEPTYNYIFHYVNQEFPFLLGCWVQYSLLGNGRSK